MDITDEMVAALRSGQAKVWSERAPLAPGGLVEVCREADVGGLVAVAPLIAAQALRSAYWKLRKHAAELRDTEVYRKASERREGTLRDSPAYQRYRWLEATARGIEDGARDLAELLGVEENEITCPACSGPRRETVGMVCQTCGTDYAPEGERLAALECRCDRKRGETHRSDCPMWTLMRPDSP